MKTLKSCVRDAAHFSSLLFLVLPSSGHSFQNESSVQREVTRAKALLMSLGVPESNLCSKTIHSISQSDQNSAALLLPLCGSYSADDERNVSFSHVKPVRFLEEEDEPHFADDDWFYIADAACALACVATAALAAGLTIGMLSLDPLMLLIKMRAGATQKEKDQAASLLPIVKQHHLLLVTLLLLNSMANEALPLFLEGLVSPFVAVILSVTFVLFFGEIIPSAIFTGPQKIGLASKMVPLVRLFMLLLLPIAYPIAKVLDVVLHEDDQGGEVAFNRGELSALVRIQYEERMAHKRLKQLERTNLQRHNSEPLPGGIISFGSLNFPKPRLSDVDAAIRASRLDDRPARSRMITPRSRESSGGSDNGFFDRRPILSNSIHVDEVSMVEGALQMKTKVAMDVLTPLHRIFAVPYDMLLTEDNVVDIYSSGYSRIPVYIPNPDKPKSITAIRGLLMTKHLIVVNMSDSRPISTLPLQIPLCVSPKMNLVDLLNLFQTGKSGHCALVCARPKVADTHLRSGRPLPPAAGLMGLITLEDVLEELLQEQIYDEMDQMEKEAEKIGRWASQKWRKLKTKRELEAAHKATSMASVVLEAMRTSSLHNDENGETTFLLAKRDNGSNGGSGRGILGFFQSLGQNRLDTNT